MVEDEQAEVFFLQGDADLLRVGKGAPVKTGFAKHYGACAGLVAKLFNQKNLRGHQADTRQKSAALYYNFRHQAAF
jgi:hypothetical protein